MHRQLWGTALDAGNVGDLDHTCAATLGGRSLHGIVADGAIRRAISDFGDRGGLWVHRSCARHRWRPGSQPDRRQWQFQRPRAALAMTSVATASSAPLCCRSRRLSKQLNEGDRWRCWRRLHPLLLARDHAPSECRSVSCPLRRDRRMPSIPPPIIFLSVAHARQALLGARSRHWWRVRIRPKRDQSRRPPQEANAWTCNATLLTRTAAHAAPALTKPATGNTGLRPSFE